VTLSAGESRGYDYDLVSLGDVTVPVVRDRDGLKAEVAEYASVGEWKRYWGLKDAFCDLRPSYAITSHKAQGSTYKRVFVDLGDIFSNAQANEALRSAYVAISRASDTVGII